ncbi:AGC protein kinase [Phytophthora cinnamomi]|uniref:AGC protein kinase n=1 Tax=Phytophthora cinnamomi TaxID=4785 RepID=UPI00355A9FE0|nr:AGC protein kinase [Phytophthora cinnamomi]
MPAVAVVYSYLDWHVAKHDVYAITHTPNSPADGARPATAASRSPSRRRPPPSSAKKPRSGSLGGFSGSFGSFGNLQLAGRGKKKDAMQSSPQVGPPPPPPRTASSRRGSIGLASGASAEDSCLFEAVASDTDCRARPLLAGSLLGNDGESPARTRSPEATAASRRQLLYGKDVDRRAATRRSAATAPRAPCTCRTATRRSSGLVIVPYREAGIWSRSICMNQFDSDSDSGSMMSYLKKALSENYGVVIMNPAAQSCHPRAHVESAWDQLVAPLLSEVFVVAFSRGAQMVLHLLNYDNGLGVMQDRVKALALVEPSPLRRDSDTYFARRMLARRAVAWILNSDIDVGCKIPQGHARGCVCVGRHGAVQRAGSSGAYALEMVKSSVLDPSPPDAARLPALR